jgi:predicted DNA-binding protein with PD1-like motif
MSRLTKSGALEEIIFARLEPGEDLLLALFDICVEYEIRTGVILEGSGALSQFVYQHFPANPEMSVLPIEVATMHGPCEASIKGTIGTYTVEDGFQQYSPVNLPTIKGVTETEQAKWHLAGSQNGHGTPYVHAHCTATNATYTACGHLMPGSFVEVVGHGSGEVPSHFSLVIGKVSGVVLENRVDEIGNYHHIYNG